jgi:glycosyltransferase involved in cell wall biosynthesis
MALAKPLIASSVGGMRDVLSDGESAFLFAPGDEHGCREAIARAATADLERMGAHALATARRRCDARDETRRYIDVLNAAQEDFHANADSGRRTRRSAGELRWR